MIQPLINALPATARWLFALERKRWKHGGKKGLFRGVATVQQVKAGGKQAYNPFADIGTKHV